MSLKASRVLLGCLAQHGPSRSAKPGMTFIILESVVLFVSFPPLVTLLTTILKSAVGLNRSCSRMKFVELAVEFDVAL